MQLKDYMTCAHGETAVVQNGYIETTNREIHHDYYFDSDGEMTVVVNGSELEELVTEPLFRNTFSTFE